ncbi:MAG: hypothetical protein Q9204_003553 [Flavoplaca sp. TL-2023a]
MAPAVYGRQSLSDPDSVHSKYEEDGSDREEEDDVGYDTDATEIDRGVDPRVQARLGLRAWTMNELDASENIEEDYATATTRLLDRCEQQYCRYIGQPPGDEYSHLSKGLLHSFFDWRLNQRRGKKGRKLRGTKLCSSLESYWKTFRLVYERASGAKIDARLTRDMHKVLRKLAKKHGLSRQPGDKPTMYVDDLVEVLQTSLTTVEKRYMLGQQRIDIHTILLLALPTGQRPEALLNLRYRYIRVTLLRDPAGGPRRMLLEFTFEFTKTFMGMKEANTFPIPEVICDPSPILRPYVFLLGRLFADRAFAVVGLTGPEGLDGLDIRPGCNELRLDFRDELADVHVFRRPVKTLYGWKMSDIEPLPYATLYSGLKILGAITGMRQIVRPYTLRYGAGKAFDANGERENQPASRPGTRDTDRHADTRTFLRHYLSRQVTADTLAIVRGLEPQDVVMHAACRMSRSIDPQRLRKLTRAQALSVNEDPDVRSLVQHRAILKDCLGYRATQNEEYCLLGREIAKTRQRKRHALLPEVQRRWDKQQAVADIEFQLAGGKFQPDWYKIVDATNGRSFEHKRLIQTGMTLPVANLEEELSRRHAAIAAVMAYCQVEEGGPRRDRNTYPDAGWAPPNSSIEKRPNAASQNTQAPEEYDILDKAMLSVFYEKRPTLCFLCLARKKLPLDKRVYRFRTLGELSKYFRRRYLENIRDDDTIECGVCNMPLDDKMYLQNYALRIHGTVS